MSARGPARHRQRHDARRGRPGHPRWRARRRHRLAGWLPSRRDAAASHRRAARPDRDRPVACRGRRRRHRPRRLHRPACRDRDGEGAGPRARLPDRRRLDRARRSWPARLPGPRCCSRPARRTASWSATASPRASSRPARNPISRRARRWWPSTWPSAPRPTPSLAARPREPGWPARSSGSGRTGCARAQWTTLRGWSLSTSRCRAGSGARAGRSRGRTTVRDPAHRADADGGPARRPRHRGRELRRALAAGGLSARPRDEPARAVPGRAGRRRDRGLRRDVADGRRGPHHHLRGPPDLASPAHRRPAAPRVPRPCRAIAARTRRRSRSGCRTCRRAGCTSGSGSARSACVRATTATTARTR